jgi:prepilin peptidase CpaA
MAATPHPQILFTAAALPPALLAAFFDLRERRIPNLLTGPTLLFGLLLHGLVEGWSRGLASAGGAALVAGLLFLVFFLAGGMGAGDVKLMAAVGAVVGMGSLEPVTMLTVLLGAAAALLLSARHRRLRETLGNVAALLSHHRREGLRPHPILHLANPSTLRLPFAVPIALGCLSTTALAVWSAR